MNPSAEDDCPKKWLGEGPFPGRAFSKTSVNNRRSIPFVSKSGSDKELVPGAGSTRQIVEVTTPAVTPLLFEAYLACPTKCFLLATDAPASDNTFATWDSRRALSYRDMGTRSLAMRHDPKEIIRDAPFHPSWASPKSGLAINVTAQAPRFATVFHAVEWGVERRDGKAASGPIPIRFVANNKLARTDRLLSAFDAYVLAKLQSAPVAFGRILHGDGLTLHKIKTAELERDVKKIVGKIVAILSATEPPKLVINRHCTECVFQERCRKLADERDDLSLLASLSDAERVKLNNKGIFSVTQLSYTFRPRRRPKHQAGRPEKYHHSLKALAIREKKVHVVGMPQFSIEGTPVFIDVEGLPDCDFYYLIGLRWPSMNGIEQRSLWADTAEDEGKLWADLLAVLSSIKSPTLVHYGSFETTFFKKMTDRYGAPTEDSVAGKALGSAINLLSVIFAHIYFPTYSNGLKEIAKYLGFNWNDPASSGLQSIVWRHEWERMRDPILKEKLIRYNLDDCEALSAVNEATMKLTNSSNFGNSSNDNAGIVYTDTLGKVFDTKWKKFKSSITGLEQINMAARWDYHRSRVYAQIDPMKRRSTKIVKKPPPCNSFKCKDIYWIPPSDCPKCGGKRHTKDRVISRRVQDIIFGTASIRMKFINNVFQTYVCRRCHHCYGLDSRFCEKNYKYGWNYLSYIVYLIVELCIPQAAVYGSVNRLLDITSRAAL